MPKLLIVDDEEDIREFAKNFFQKRDIDVFTAADGQKALDLIKLEKPDLVLLDVHMEDMTGIEVLKTLREGNNQIKAIMVTGIEDEAVVREANNYGALGYIHKPLILDELKEVVLKELDLNKT